MQVDSLGNICKTFERLVMPCVHAPLCQVIELTGITDRNLKGSAGLCRYGRTLPLGREEKELFLGNCDKAVLLSNLLYTIKSTAEKACRCTICRRCLTVPFLKGGQQTSLSGCHRTAWAASLRRSYHSALSDAVNAANIMRSLGGESFVYKNQVKVLERLRLRSAAANARSRRRRATC